MSGNQPQRPQSQQAAPPSAQIPNAQNWLASLPGYQAVLSAAVSKGLEQGAAQNLIQQGARQHAQLPSTQVARPQMLYATGQQVSSQSYPGAFLPRVQMVPAAHMNSAAMQTLQAFGGSTYRPPVSSAQTYSSTQIAPLNTASRPASTARPSSQPAPAVYQALRPQVGESNLQGAAPSNSGTNAGRPTHVTQQTYQAPALLSEEDRKVLPRRSLKRKAQASLGDPRAEVEPLMEVALVNLADEFISNAVAFSCGLARRRKSLRLDSADVATYLDRTWQINVPGFDGPQVQPYRKYLSAPAHQDRVAMVRKEIAVASKAAADNS